jgi:hypothetical protein
LYIKESSRVVAAEGAEEEEEEESAYVSIRMPEKCSIVYIEIKGNLFSGKCTMLAGFFPTL